MKAFLITSVIVLVLALAGAVYYGFTLISERNSLQAELTSVQATLASTQQELTTAQQELATTQATLDDTETQLDAKAAALADTEDELSQTKDTLTTTETTLAATQDDLTDTQAALSDTKGELQDTKMDLLGAEADLRLAASANRQLQNDLDEAEDRLTTATQTLAGLGITLFDSVQCYDVNLIDNPNAVDPTWAELKAFLAQDATENHVYIANLYDCSQFSRDLHNRAEAAGIRCAEVQVAFQGEYIGHALCAFLTTDYGLVYVDDTEAPDKIARVVAEAAYRAVSVSGFYPANLRNNYWWSALAGNYYYLPDSHGGQAVVAYILIYW